MYNQHYFIHTNTHTYKHINKCTDTVAHIEIEICRNQYINVHSKSFIHIDISTNICIRTVTAKYT